MNKVPPETGACLPCYFSQPVKNSSPLFGKKYDISPTDWNWLKDILRVDCSSYNSAILFVPYPFIWTPCRRNLSTSYVYFCRSGVYKAFMGTCYLQIRWVKGVSLPKAGMLHTEHILSNFWNPPKFISAARSCCSHIINTTYLLLLMYDYKDSNFFALSGRIFLLLLSHHYFLFAVLLLLLFFYCCCCCLSIKTQLNHQQKRRKEILMEITTVPIRYYYSANKLPPETGACLITYVNPSITQHTKLQV